MGTGGWNRYGPGNQVTVTEGIAFATANHRCYPQRHPVRAALTFPSFPSLSLRRPVIPHVSLSPPGPLPFATAIPRSPTSPPSSLRHSIRHTSHGEQQFHLSEPPIGILHFVLRRGVSVSVPLLSAGLLFFSSPRRVFSAGLFVPQRVVLSLILPSDSRDAEGTARHSEAFNGPCRDRIQIGIRSSPGTA